MKVGDVVHVCICIQVPPFFCAHHLNEYGAVPPVPLAVNVTAVPTLTLLELATSEDPVIANPGCVITKDPEADAWGVSKMAPAFRTQTPIM